MSEDNTNPHPQKPSITPSAKPKFKVTQSPFAPKIEHRDSQDAGLAEDTQNPTATDNPMKPRPEAPKPMGVKPSTLKPAEARVSSVTQSGLKAPKTTKIPFATQTPFSVKPLGPTPEEIEAEKEHKEKVFMLVNVSLQGLAAVAAIVFAALALVELMPFIQNV